MTGRTGRVVKRKVPPDKKPKESTIPINGHTEKDAVIEKLKGKS